MGKCLLTIWCVPAVIVVHTECRDPYPRPEIKFMFTRRSMLLGKQSEYANRDMVQAIYLCHLCEDGFCESLAFHCYYLFLLPELIEEEQD